jgi:hypothetical protein
VVQTARRHVRGPYAIHATRAETSTHTIRRNRKVMTAVRGPDETPASARTESRHAHQPGHALPADGDATGTQRAAQARPAIRLSAIGVRQPQLGDQTEVLWGVPRGPRPAHA